jgi:hypothetical protein
MTKHSKDYCVAEMIEDLFFRLKLQRFGEPGEVIGAAGEDGQNDAFGKIVAVEIADGLLDLRDELLGGLDDEKAFLGAVDFILPAIDAPDAGEDVDTGGEAAFDQGDGDDVGLGGGGGSGQQDAEVCHGCGTCCRWIYDSNYRRQEPGKQNPKGRVDEWQHR